MKYVNIYKLNIVCIIRKFIKLLWTLTTWKRYFFCMPSLLLYYTITKHFDNVGVWQCMFAVSESKVRSDSGIPLQRYLNIQFVLITDSYTELEVRPLQVKCWVFIGKIWIPMNIKMITSVHRKCYRCHRV